MSFTVAEGFGMKRLRMGGSSWLPLIMSGMVLAEAGSRLPRTLADDPEAVPVLETEAETEPASPDAEHPIPTDPDSSIEVGDDSHSPEVADPTPSTETSLDPPPESQVAPSEETQVAPAAEPPAAASVERLRATIDVVGELFAPAGRDAPPIRRPIAVGARFDFIERPLSDVEEPTVERRYTDAAADLEIDGHTQRTMLADDARTVRVVLRGTTPAAYLEGGFLSREEMDLLEMPFDPLLIDALRPASAVAIGDSWVVAADLAAGLLAVDTVDSGTLDARLAAVEDGRATVTLAGIIDGAADGVPTHVTVEGSFVVPVDEVATGSIELSARIATLAMTLRERREASHVAPGFDVEARIAVARTSLPAIDTVVEPTTSAIAVTSGSAAGSRRQGVGRPGLVWQRDPGGRYNLVHDERWRVIEDGTEGLVMRFVDRGALVAQCSITALPRSSALSPPTIAEVERDIQRSLAGQFSRIEHASEASRSDGVRIVRVATAGRAGDLPFRWIHHVLTDAAGHRLAVTCMLEESLSKRFDTADRELIDGIMFPATEAESTPETAGAEGPAGDREARLPTESRTP